MIPESKVQDARREGLHPKRVLVVDDDPEFRASIRPELERDGFEVLEARTGQEALEWMDRLDGEIAVALVDESLPDSNDLILLDQAGRRIPRCPVIVLTIRGDETHRRQSIQRGAYQCFDKLDGLGHIIHSVRSALHVPDEDERDRSETEYLQP